MALVDCIATKKEKTLAQVENVSRLLHFSVTKAPGSKTYASISHVLEKLFRRSVGSSQSTPGKSGYRTSGFEPISLVRLRRYQAPCLCLWCLSIGVNSANSDKTIHRTVPPNWSRSGGLRLLFTFHQGPS
jgi:hypothetical protein